MKTNKTTVLKYSQYTAALTSSLKNAPRLHCRIDEDGKIVYVCSGYFLVKLTPSEYDALVRPVTQREAGNFVMDQNGETNPAEPLDMAKLLTDAAAEAVHELTPAPFLVDPHTKGTKAKIATYYSKSGGFVAGFNSDYAAIISNSLHRKSKSPISPMVVYFGDEPLAMILPVRLDKNSRIPAAVRAYFTNANPVPNDDVEKLRRENEQLRQCYAKEHIDRSALERQIDELKAALASKNEQIEALTERLNARPAAVEESQQPQTPADKAAALVEKLTALKGVTATIKGTQTAAPVVWLAGEADAHKDKIEAMGGKWSAKRDAWYFKI